MEREEVEKQLESIDTKIVNLVLPTGYGKSKLAIDYVSKYNPSNILIVIPRLVLIDNWKKEFIKWNKRALINRTTFVTYVSLYKYAGQSFDACILDEGHHLSERAREAFETIKIKHTILLSATVKSTLRDYLSKKFNTTTLEVSTREAINKEVLPEPTVYLLPLELDNTTINHNFIINPKAKAVCKTIQPITNLWRCKKVKDVKFTISCTERQFYNQMDDIIAFYKRKSSSRVMHNMWLHKCSERLTWLSERKLNIVKQIIAKTTKYRTLTFCNNIEQTELLGKYCINSSNGKAEEYLELFNSGKIKHITACNMLNEGVNLTNCQVGIYANLNSSDTIVKQRLGRILRHKHPVIIIPYFKNTRDEELVNKMIENYNPEYIKVVDSIDNIIINS